MKLRVVAILLACIGGLASSASAQTARRDLGVHFPGQTVANPRGSLALSVNPAGLGLLDSWELRLQTALGGGPVGGAGGSGWALFAASKLGPLRLASAAEHRSDIEQSDALLLSRLSFGVALPLGDRVAIGAATRMHGAAATGHDVPWSSDLGVLVQPWSWISLGWRVTGLGDPGVALSDGTNAYTTRYAWGIALRPFAGSDRLTLAFDVDWPAGGQLGNVTFSAAGRVIDGLGLMLEHRQVTHRIGGTRQEEQRTSLLIDIGLGHWGVELGLRGDRSLQAGEGGGVQLGARLSGDVPHSLIDPGPRAVIVPLGNVASEAPGRSRPFGALLLELDALRRDPAVQTVVFRFDGASFTWAQVEELRVAIAELRHAGKRTASYAASLGTRGYMVACATERIGMPEAGTLGARGVGTDFVGLADALARIGISVQAIRYADYKSAPETFTRSRLGPALRETLQRVVRKRYDAFLEAVSLGRSLTPTAVDAALGRGVVVPDDARRALFIDVVASPKDFEKSLRTWGMLGKDERLRPYRAPQARRKRFGPRPRIAVLALAGTIVDGSNSNGLSGRRVGGRDTRKLLAELARRSDVKAVVARVDSGGGAVYGSELIYQGLLEVSDRKPTAVSMASVAASGGYWLSLGADRIFADRATVTGSIGIFTLKPDLSGTLALLGVGVEHVAAGPGTTAEDPKQPWSPLEEAVLRRSLGRYYDMFLDRVSLRRKIDKASLERLAGGRIHLGARARERRLVDTEGGLLAALADVRARAGLADDDEVEVFFVPRGGLSLRLGVALGAWIGRVLGEAPPSAATATAAIGQALVKAAGPWLDEAAVLASLPTGTPLAITPIPRDLGAP